MRPAFLVLAILVALVRCSDYKPAEPQFRERMAPFIISGARDVTPQYANQDVDSMFGRYTAPQPPDVVFSTIEHQGAAHGWHVVRRDPTLLELHRTTAGRVPSYEIVRVVMRAPVVHVAWLQMDGPANAEAAAHAHEAQWAAVNFWPEFEQSLGK
jgi:hypothetical protein